MTWPPIVAVTRIRRWRYARPAPPDPQGLLPATCRVTEARERQFVSEPTANLVRRLTELRSEHRDLDLAIDRLSRDADSDELGLRRLKKRRLRLKDMIAYIENKLIPDLDA